MTTNQYKILIIADEKNLPPSLTTALICNGYQVDSVIDSTDGAWKLAHFLYDFILCDMSSPKISGKSLFSRLLEREVSSLFIMITDNKTINVAIKCMKMGAHGYISKPFKNDEIIILLKRAEEFALLRSENKRLHKLLESDNSCFGIVSRNRTMQNQFDKIYQVSKTTTPVLISGEPGTGKGLVAHAIHACSCRADQPFVVINCGVSPINILENELFYHVQRLGNVSSCKKGGQTNLGTIFLDEIGELPPVLQTKLLRVLRDEDVDHSRVPLTIKGNMRIPRLQF